MKTIEIMILAGASVILSSCSCNRQDAPQITPPATKQAYIDQPFKAVDIPFTHYEVDASQGATLEYGSGTVLTIPACAFLDDSGNVVQDKVDISYREFHTPEEILVSGIPMDISRENNTYLESAGMLEIRVNLNGKELRPNPDCQVQVDMASQYPQDNYNLYALDTANRSWVEKLKNLPVKINLPGSGGKKANYENLAAQAGIVKPIKPRVANPSRYQFKYKIDLSEFPEMNIYDGIEWEFAGRANSAQDPKKNPWVLSAFWQEMTLDKTSKKGVYKLTLTSNGKTFSTKVRPVFDSVDQEYAMEMYNEKYEKYRGFVAKKKEEERLRLAKLEKQRKERERRIAQQQKVNDANVNITRSFKLDNFGIYNCDRPFTQNDPLQLAANFFSKGQRPIGVSRVFLIEKSTNSVIQYYSTGLNQFRFVPEMEYTAIVLDTASFAHVIDSRQFSTVPRSAKEATFQAKADGRQISSMDDVNRLFGRI